MNAGHGPTCTQVATDGMPSVVTTNNMYQPGGARLADAGAVAVNPVGVVVTASWTRRAFISTACVVEPGAMSTAEPTAGPDVAMSKLAP